MVLKHLVLGVVMVSLSSTTVIASGGKNLVTGNQNGRALSFAVIGDGPYGDDKESAYDRLINDINSDHKVDFVIHVGDIKSGGTQCTDERLIRRFDQLQQIRSALVYTPGDNEWTDCHRVNNGSWNPLERLAFIRNLFFPNPNWTTGQVPRYVLSQSNFEGYEQFVENALFDAGPITVATIHVVGSNNNLRTWSGIDPNDTPENPRVDRIAEYEARNAASLYWLEQTFRHAEAENSAGVFIAIHADLNFQLAPDDAGRNGFNPFQEKLFLLAKTYDRPVVISHGDSHLYRIDMPRLAPYYHNGDGTSPADNLLVPKLTRMEVFGDSDVHWVKVTADPHREEVFQFAPRIVVDNLPGALSAE